MILHGAQIIINVITFYIFYKVSKIIQYKTIFASLESG